MTEHLVLECPLCGKQRICSAMEMSPDKAIDVVGTHVYEHHPTVPPEQAEDVIGEAVDGMDVESVEDSKVEMKRWDHFGI